MRGQGREGAGVGRRWGRRRRERDEDQGELSRSRSREPAQQPRHAPAPAGPAHRAWELLPALLPSWGRTLGLGVGPEAPPPGSSVRPQPWPPSQAPCSPAKSLINPAFHLPSPSPAAPGGLQLEAGREEEHKPRQGAQAACTPFWGVPPGPGEGKPQRARCDPKGTAPPWDQLVNLSGNEHTQVPPPLPGGFVTPWGGAVGHLG